LASSRFQEVFAKTLTTAFVYPDPAAIVTISVKPDALVPLDLQFAPVPSPKICNLGAIWKLSP